MSDMALEENIRKTAGEITMHTFGNGFIVISLLMLKLDLSISVRYPGDELAKNVITVC